MSRRRIERGGFVYPLQDDVGDPEDAEGWSEESDTEWEPIYALPSYSPEILDLAAERRDVEEDPVGVERDESWVGRSGRAH